MPIFPVSDTAFSGGTGLAVEPGTGPFLPRLLNQLDDGAAQQIYIGTAADNTYFIFPPEAATGMHRFEWYISIGAAADELMVFTVSRVRAGVATVIVTDTIDDSFGDNSLEDATSTINTAITLEPGDMIFAEADYTAGGGPTPMKDMVFKLGFS